MKRILPIALILMLLSVAASSQGGLRNFRGRATELTRFERLQLRKDILQYKIAQRNAERDGMVTPFEKRWLQKKKQKVRRDAFRYRHNGRGRVI